MEVNRAYCLFEQSGTFKREFIKLGIPAEDYDIRDDFGETDHIVDLFAQIDSAYAAAPSLFDQITPADIVMAFFPCTRFECQSQMLLSGSAYQLRTFSVERKLEYAIKTHEELHFLYSNLCKLCILALRRGWPLIVENPASAPHYLTTYFPIKPAIIDRDRTRNGDFYKKPTQFWFINCKPEQNLPLEPLEFVERRRIETETKCDGVDRVVRRSQIYPQYARNFILSFILDEQ